MSRPNSLLSPRRIRPTAKLGTVVNCRLQAYVIAARGAVSSKTTLAASALSIAGVALIASVPAEAEIVYTPANIQIQNSRSGVVFVQLDINNDGQPDFEFQAQFGQTFSSGNHVVYASLAVTGDLSSNQVMSTGGDFLRKQAAALQLGARIGPEGKFAPHPVMAVCDSFNGSPESYGQWVHVQNRYLGVKFQIDGETHYGWVRMNVHCNDGTVTGYAYETVANRPLDAGILPYANQSEASPEEPQQVTPKPVTLGALAAGVVGLSTWRLR